MPQIVKQWTFDHDLQDLVVADASNVLLRFEPSDGNDQGGSGPGCAAFVVSPNANPGDDIHCAVDNSASHTTWESWGVPPGAIVVGVNIAVAWRFVSDVGMTPGSDYFDLGVYSPGVFDAGVFGNGYMLDPDVGGLPFGTDVDGNPGWNYLSGTGELSIPERHQNGDGSGVPSGTPVMFWMQFGCALDTGSPNIELRVDDLAPTILYYMPAGISGPEHRRSRRGRHAGVVTLMKSAVHPNGLRFRTAPRLTILPPRNSL